MTLPKRPAVTALVGALVIGVLGDALLRGTPWGVNFPLWIASLAVASYLALAGHPPSDRRAAAWWLGTAVLFAAMFAWRDAAFLNFWNFLAVLAAFSIAALQASGVQLAVTHVREYVVGAVRTGLHLGGGAGALALVDTPWREMTPAHGVPRLGRYALGAALAVPVTLVFGGLFASADPVFQGLVDDLFAWDWESLWSHLLLTGFCAWLGAGLLRSLVKPGGAWHLESGLAGRLGMPEIGIPLGAMVLLFLVFTAIQAGYLFGGEEFVLETTGLSYAAYARRGFFELVTATGLVLPTLLTANWALDRESEKAVLSFGALAVVLLVLVDLVAVSGIWRMRLYVSSYGLTVDRFYATAFMVWIAILLGWFAFTVLRDRCERFAFGAVLSGFGLLAFLNLLNPEAHIARVKLDRLREGREFDVSYIQLLSADAVPTVAGAWSVLDVTQRCELTYGFLDRKAERAPSDWRTWNVARYRASRSLGGRRAVLPEPALCGWGSEATDQSSSGSNATR